MASALLFARAISISGIVLRRRPVGPALLPAVAGAAAPGRRLDGWTRGASPACLSYMGGHGASGRPAAWSRTACSSNAASDPAASSISAHGSPIAANRSGMVNRVYSAGSQAGTSSQVNGAETRTSGTGRTEYAEATVRSLAFWL
jgi:hypothetical protein